MLYMH